MIFNIPPNEIDEGLLHGLVGTLEDRQLEFKEVLPSRNPNHIIEKFLKPISAMANTLGGDVLFGIREARNSDGHTVANAILGIAGEDPDDVIQRLENLMRTSIDPRIVGHTILPVRLKTGNFVYLVRVPNFDGLLSAIERNPALGYVQLYRSGAIESVDTNFLDDEYEGERCVRGRSLEEKIVAATLRYLDLLKDLGVRSPVLVNLSLLKVRGYIMRDETKEFGGRRTRAPRGSIDRDDLLLRGKLIQAIPLDLNEEFVRDLLREDFHAIWNATGFDGSPSYD